MNTIKSLIISNIAETYFRTYRKSNPQQAKKLILNDFLEAERGMFYTQEAKVIITSTPIDKTFLKDTSKLLQYEIQNYYPQTPTERICHDCLNDSKLFKRLETIITQNPGIALIPYYATEEFFELTTILRQKGLKFTTPETVSSKNRFIRDHYNCKVGFRKLWDKATDEHSYVKIPHGFIVDNLKEAIEAAWWFYQKNTDFVFKYNRGTSGFGIVFYHCKDLPKDETEFKQFLKSRHKERIWFEEGFVVEEYIDLDTSSYGGSPSIEFKINGSVKHSYNCLQRLGEKSYFEGVLLSQEAEQNLNFDIQRVIDNCKEFGEALEEFGYKGIFDIDLVVDKKYNVYAVESNLRRTGGTHIHETATHLLGRNYASKYAIISRDNLPISKNIKTYQEFKEKVGHLYYTPQNKKGIIPIITSFISLNLVGVMIIGKNVEESKQLEQLCIELLQ